MCLAWKFVGVEEVAEHYGCKILFESLQEMLDILQ